MCNSTMWRNYKFVSQKYLLHYLLVTAVKVEAERCRTGRRITRFQKSQTMLYLYFCAEERQDADKERIQYGDAFTYRRL